MRKLRTFIGFLITTVVVNCFSNILLKEHYEAKYNKNLLIYADEIEEYEFFLNEYANYIKDLNLSDLEIIIKVMIDTLSQIDGYGVADNLISGYYGLSFMLEGKGVCTSFADDFTRKINKINPEYNARNVIVYLDEKKLEDQMTIPVTMNFVCNSLKNKKMIDNIANNHNMISFDKKSINEYVVGNHMITVIEIPEYNIKLAIDPTNFMIGYFCNLRFDFFGNNEKNEMKYRDTTIKFSNRSITDELNFLFESFFDPTINYDKIEDIYGYQAQEEAYDYVKELYPYTKEISISYNDEVMHYLYESTGINNYNYIEKSTSYSKKLKKN